MTADQTPLVDRRCGGLPRGRRASDRGRHVWGLEIEEVYEAGRIGSAFGLLLLTPVSAVFVTLNVISPPEGSLFRALLEVAAKALPIFTFTPVPLAEVVRERLEVEVRRAVALFLIGGWGGIGVAVGRQLADRAATRAGVRSFGARLAACVAGGTLPAVAIAETIRRLVAVFSEPPISGPLAAAISIGAGAYMAAGLTIVRAMRHGDLGRRLAQWGLAAALLASTASVLVAFWAGTAVSGG